MFHIDHRIPLKTPRDLDRMRDSCRVLADVFEELDTFMAPGITTHDIDRLIHEAIVRRAGTPAFLNLYGFPASACISVNEELVHGIPSRSRPLGEGDIVSVDMGVRLRGWYSDRAVTYAVGTPRENARRLIEATEDAFWAGAIHLKPGARLGDAQHAIQKTVEAAGFHVVRKYVGHGIGRELHEAPQVPNFGKPGDGIRLKPGMVLAVEPMVGEGTAETEELADGWTVVMADRSLAAHYEHTVAITERGPEILTWDATKSRAKLSEAVGKWSRLVTESVKI